MNDKVNQIVQCDEHNALNVNTNMGQQCWTEGANDLQPEDLWITRKKEKSDNNADKNKTRVRNDQHGC